MLSGLAACGEAASLPTAAPARVLALVAQTTDEHQGNRYTLVLGDSYAFGYQPGKDLADPSSYNTGFGTDFVGLQNAAHPRTHHVEVNLGCPFETSESFISGGCLYTAVFGHSLHVSYGGSQLAAADSFLRQHDDRVDVILLSLGGADVIVPATFDCENDDACLKTKLPEILRRVEPNFDRILDHLKALAPRATVVVLIEYHLVRISDIVNIGLSGVYRREREEGYEHRAVVVESDPIIPATRVHVHHDVLRYPLRYSSHRYRIPRDRRCTVPRDGAGARGAVGELTERRALLHTSVT